VHLQRHRADIPQGLFGNRLPTGLQHAAADGRFGAGGGLDGEKAQTRQERKQQA
jgi:hypothetical protein